MSEDLKTSDDAAHDHVLGDVKDFIQKIESIAERINLSLFEDFFESSSPADDAKMLINTENSHKSKKFVAEIKDRISNLKDTIKKMNETEKINKSAGETLEIIKEILDYNKNVQKNFQLASKVDKGKSEPKSEESIAERTILRKGMVSEIDREKKQIKNNLFKNYFTNYQGPSDMYKKLPKTEGKKNEDRAYPIKKVIIKIKKLIEKVPEDKISMIEENEKIVNIVDNILKFNRQEEGQGLKMLTPNQMLSRLLISLAQLKAGNNSEKLKNEIRQLLYSLYRSEQLTKQLYKSLIDII